MIRLLTRIFGTASLCLACVTAFANAQRAEDVPTFDILEYRVLGNTQLPSLAIETAVYPFLGPGKDMATIEAARASLERAYHDAGYLTVAVDIPEQQVKNGRVRLRVTEGRVQRLQVTGNKYFSRGEIIAAVPAVAPGTVPNFPQLQEQLTALARTPDRKITPVIKPGEQPGEVDVELKVDDRLPLHGSLELNNQNSINTDPLRAQATLRYDNLWQLGHSISGLVQTAPQDPQQSQVYAATYVMPVSSSGAALAFYGVRSMSNVAAVGATTVIGNGYILGGRAIFPLPAYDTYNHSFTAGLDYKNFEDNIQLGGETLTTPVSYIPWLLQYSASYAGQRGTTQGSVGLNFAPRGYFVNDDTEFENKRFNAKSSYAYLRASLEHDRALMPKLKLGLRLTGQVADQPLISNEQFAAGGANSVRGYFEAERLGDDGVQGSFQLSTSGLFGEKAGIANDLVAFVFVDGAALWVLDPLPGQEARFNLASVGVGLSLHAWRHFDALVDLALPLIDGVETKRGEPRVLFKVALEF